ncbi:MAG: hypothetical protein RL885_11065 [Planctomycetota bacterium]
MIHKTLLSMLAVLFLSGVGFAQIQINEIRIDQPSDDNDEYFELVGPANASLDGLTYLVIGDGSTASGTIEAVIDLTGLTLDGNGFFVAAESTFTLGTADFTTSLNFENSDNVTHMLVSGFTGLNGDDLDFDDDCSLDVTPWSTIEDSIALVETPPALGECLYGLPRVGPDGNFVPGHAFRCFGGNWAIGSFDPSGGSDSPGADNAACSDLLPRLSEIRIDQPSNDDDEYFELQGQPGWKLDGLSYIVIGDGTGGSGVIDTDGVIDLTGQVIDSNGFFTCAESTFTAGNADYITDLGFENSDNVTHLLVANNTASAGDDLDTDDDGVLDVTPWDSIVDSVALIETVGSGDLVYSSTQVGPDGSFVPGHVFRCHGDNWFIGPFDIAVGWDTPDSRNTQIILNGPLAASTPFNFTICAEGAEGDTAIVLWSCTGSASNVSAPDGRPIPITADVCTALALNLGTIFTGTVGLDGIANTPIAAAPANTPVGFTFYLAGVTLSSSGFNQILDSVAIVSE